MFCLENRVVGNGFVFPVGDRACRCKVNSGEVVVTQLVLRVFIQKVREEG